MISVNVGFDNTFFVQVLRFLVDLNFCVSWFLLAAYFRFTISFGKEYERVLKARITTVADLICAKTVAEGKSSLPEQSETRD